MNDLEEDGDATSKHCNEVYQQKCTWKNQVQQRYENIVFVFLGVFLFVFCLLPTSPILVAKIWKAPNVAESNRDGDAGEEEVELVGKCSPLCVVVLQSFIQHREIIFNSFCRDEMLGFFLHVTERTFSPSKCIITPLQ